MLTTLIAGVGSTQQDVERVLSKVVEFAPNGVALTNADGRILLANAELERMFGYVGAEMLERQIEQLMPERFRAGHAMLRAREGKDSQLMGAGRELFGRRADGTEFPIEIGLSTLETADGAMVVETIVDISVRKRLERMFQKMVEAAPCGMVMIEPRGRIVLVNPQLETMFGYGRAELIGAPLEMLLPERFRATHGSHRRAFATAPSIRQMGVGRDLTARRKDGTEFPVEIGLNPVPGEEGGLVLAAVSDITRRKSMELELEQANANLEEFTYAASHDLKSPLRGIADLVEWIGEDLGTSVTPEVARNLGRVGDRVRRLEQLIDDLLKYARAGTVSAETVAVDPRILVAGILEIQPVPPTYRITVHIDAAPFVTSKTPLETALRNIISNAIKHHDLPNGSMEIRVEEVDRYCVFTVNDDGPGIPLSAQERVFRVFQTLAPATHGASGIGLALSKRLVESHGGRLTLSSTEGVRGASFRIWWPRLLRNREP
jgi:PAS domain S-box-containing protein